MSKKKSDVAAVGIDVAKRTLSVCCRTENGAETALTLRNTEADIRRRLLPRLKNFRGRIVMESTGHYHWRTALILSGEGHDVRVVNPILAKQYTSASIRKVKTDPMDASGLARMAQVADNLPARFSRTAEELSLRKKLSCIEGISRQLQALRATLGQLEESRKILGGGASKAELLLRETIDGLKKTRDVFEKEFVDGSATLQDRGAVENVDSIPGVSRFVAHLVLHWFAPLPGASAKSWVGYAGLDVSSRESGTWRGRCRVTKRGNSFLRRRLYSAAWGAVMHDRNFRAYYDELRAGGRAHVEALVIVARKLVRTMHRMVQTGESYDPDRFAFGGVDQLNT